MWSTWIARSPIPRRRESDEVGPAPFRSFATARRSATICEDSLFYRADPGAMLGGRVSDSFRGYAYLTGRDGTVVEIAFLCSSLRYKSHSEEG